jgi:hypothetical protein
LEIGLKLTAIDWDFVNDKLSVALAAGRRQSDLKPSTAVDHGEDMGFVRLVFPRKGARANI